MDKDNESQQLDRHALVLAIWLPAGFLALALLHRGFSVDGDWWLAGGFAAILGGYACHVIVNAVTGTRFSPREVALGLFAMLCAIIAFVFATFMVADFATRFFLPLILGMAALVAAVILYMVIRFGPRPAFQTFDIIRDNNPRRASRLPHRGGRR